jgi:hypothetical protein
MSLENAGLGTLASSSHADSPAEISKDLREENRSACRSPHNAERDLASRHFIDAFDRLHSGECWAAAAPVDQRVDGRLVALCDNFDRSLGPVANGACYAKALSLSCT